MTRTVREDNPLVRYTDRTLWGNPELDHQFQVGIERLSTELGFIKNFNYMGRWRTLPDNNRFYHIFTVGGLHPGFWSFREKFRTRNPLDRWVRVDDVAQVHGIQLDVYDNNGIMFPRTKVWMMATYDGLVLLAFEKLILWPIPISRKMYFRTYNPTIKIDKFNLRDKGNANPFAYEGMTYENSVELNIFQGRFDALKAKPGLTACYHNGIFTLKAPIELTLVIGDEVEIWHDPSVKGLKKYKYKDCRDFYSDLDKKRKLILHPPKNNNWKLRYFDDSDFYIVRPDKYGLYYHRNSISSIRQLTHADISIADDQIKNQMTSIGDIGNIDEFVIYEFVRDTEWEFEWPFDAQRIHYLYRLDDEHIQQAMTGTNSQVPEWQGTNLEKGPVMTLVQSQFKDITTEMSKNALGYNGLTLAMSETPVRVKYSAGWQGMEVPPTYVGDFVAYEYDADGKLLEWNQFYGTRYFAPRNPACELAEFVGGIGGRKLNYLVTNNDVEIVGDYGFRVYVGKWNIINQAFVGELTDKTGTDLYEVINGYIVFKKLDTVNTRAMVVFNDRFLAYGFELDHWDKSLSFGLTDVYDDGRLYANLCTAQLDIWLNGHPLIDNVDWFFDKKNFYIVNKEFLVDGPQRIDVRGYGLHSDVNNPKTETELGYVDGGVIGNIPRYNCRLDRATRFVTYGQLKLTKEQEEAELVAPHDLNNPLNGRPYMVKHSYVQVRYAEQYEDYPLYPEARDLDRRITDYLTKYAIKPVPVVISNLMDKYRVFSPFLNAVVNGLLINAIVLPDMGKFTIFPSQVVEDLVKPYKFWLTYDPGTKGFDQRYFAIMPYANVDKLTVTAQQLAFISQANDLYMKSVCEIEGHFEVI